MEAFSDRCVCAASENSELRSIERLFQVLQKYALKCFHYGLRPSKQLSSDDIGAQSSSALGKSICRLAYRGVCNWISDTVYLRE